MDIEYNYQRILFEWNEEKAASNFSKHKVFFEAACEIFSDPFIQNRDAEYIDEEWRETAIGVTETLRLLYVAYTIRDDKVRIISARTVTKKERKDYENQ